MCILNTVWPGTLRARGTIKIKLPPVGIELSTMTITGYGCSRPKLLVAAPFFPKTSEKCSKTPTNFFGVLADLDLASKVGNWKIFPFGTYTPSQSEIFSLSTEQPGIMMATAIPLDMLLHMDWNAEDKLAVWTFYTERLKQYFMIAHKPRKTRSHISCSLVARRHLRDGQP